MMKNRNIFILTLSLGVVACGGGSGGEKSEPLEGPSNEIVMLDYSADQLIKADLRTQDYYLLAENVTHSDMAFDKSTNSIYTVSSYDNIVFNYGYYTGQYKVLVDDSDHDNMEYVVSHNSYLYGIVDELSGFDFRNVATSGSHTYRIRQINKETGDFEDHFWDSTSNNLVIQNRLELIAVGPDDKMYAIEYRLDHNDSDAFCLSGTCESTVDVYEVTINEDNSDTFIDNGSKTLIYRVPNDNSLYDAEVSSDGNYLYVLGKPEEGLFRFDLVNNEFSIIDIDGMRGESGRYFFDIESNDQTAIVVNQDIGVYRLDLTTGKTMRIVKPKPDISVSAMYITE